MECQNCKQFRNAKWRSTPENNEKAKTRYCDNTKKYVSGIQDSCNLYEPDNRFHCKRYNYMLDTIQCINRRKNSIFKKCTGTCTQYANVVELHKQYTMYERKRKPTILVLRTPIQKEIHDGHQT